MNAKVLVTTAQERAEKAHLTNKTATKAVEYAQTAGYYLACGNEDAAVYWANRAIKEAK